MRVRLRHLAVLAAATLVAGCTHDTGASSASATDSPGPVGSPVASSSPAETGSPAVVASASTAAPLAAGSGSPLAGVLPAATAAPVVAFDDLTGSQHATAIVALGQLGVLDSTSGHFRPNDPVLRRDFVRWLFRTNNAVFANLSNHVIHGAQSDDPSDFTDMTSKDPDFTYVQGLSTAGVSVGFPDKTFRPDASITREQALAIKSALDFGGVNVGFQKDQSFARYHLPQWKDRDLVSKTYVAAIGQDMDQEHDDGVDNIGRTFGTIAVFRPQKTLSRGEAAEMFQRIGGHAENMSYENEMRTVPQALHPTPAPT